MRALWPLNNKLQRLRIIKYEVLLSDWRLCFSSSLHNHVQYIKHYNSTIFFLATEQLHKNSSSVITLTIIRHVLTLFHMGSKILHIHRGRGRIPPPSSYSRPTITKFGTLEEFWHFLLKNAKIIMQISHLVKLWCHQ